MALSQVQDHSHQTYFAELLRQATSVDKGESIVCHWTHCYYSAALQDTQKSAEWHSFIYFSVWFHSRQSKGILENLSLQSPLPQLMLPFL